VAPAQNETWVWSVSNDATINAVPANGGQSISVTAGTQDFTLTLTKTYANTSLPNQVCPFPITINPPAAAPNVTYVPPTCIQNTFKVVVNNPEAGSTYTLVQLDGNTVVKGPYVSGVLEFTGLHIGQGYSVSSVTSAGCASLPNDCGTFTHARSTQTVTHVTDDDLRVTQQPTVLAAPNPFSDKIRFSIKSPVAGRASLELFNMMGQKLKTIYEGNMSKDMIQTIEYNVPFSQRANLIYLFRIGTYKSSGKLIGIK
jgi:hypothetical protein